MKFDAIIIGTGQAGKPLSFALGDLGWKIALIERENPLWRDLYLDLTA